jgi:hypothetical protein
MIKLSSPFFVLTILVTALFVVKAKAANELYVGPTVGVTTVSSPDGSLNRDTQGSFGADGFYILDRFALGLSYRNFGNFSDGNPTVNINQVNNWISAEGKYLFDVEGFHPYVSLGAGSVTQTVTTTVMGSAAVSNGVYFARDLGVGILGRIGSDSSVGFNVGARYFQYSNISGFDYIVSIGFFPKF